MHATLNQYSGVQAGAMSTVRHSRAVRNFGSGFALSGGLLQSSMADGNAGHGINAAGVYVTGVRESVFNSNGLGDIGGAASMGNNLCTGKLAC